ncbi:MAG TPA: TonB-dependent receptor, partial [Rhodocyclaceae bacterium]|nr:TonB-dependent receptor [Rhodocyclaceae bacterium]
ASIYSYSDSGKVHASASDRTRFPTMFDRFSSRFGGAISNPGLDPERALNVELGVADTLLPGVRGEAAIFHSHITDAIESVPVIYNGTSYTQSQNVGEETTKGVEFGLTARISSALEVGGNYSYVHNKIDNPNNPAMRQTVAPQNKAFMFAKWTPSDAWSVTPSLEYAGQRWSTSAANSNLYVQTDAYTLLNLKVEYMIRHDWSVSLAARNLTDKDYQVVDGYPQEGRNFVLATRFQF